MTASRDPHAPTPRSDASTPGSGPVDDTVATPDAPGVPADGDAPGALAAPFVKAKFDGLVLVCGQCEKRSSGPSKLTAKDARKTLKSALGDKRSRLRIVQSSCLGLCPKKSIAIAAAAQGTPSLLAEVRNERELEAVAARLTGRSGHS